LIVVDTSSLQRFLAGIVGPDTNVVARAIARHEAYVPPVVVTEALSNRFLADIAVDQILKLPVLRLIDGYWIRAGRLRAKLGRQNMKAKLADTLIAQACLDHDAPLITYDDDFDNFVHVGLKLL
jgi:predicted nucleic acid-binding protein